MKETVTFAAVKSDRESNGKRYLNLVDTDGRELTISYPLDPAERKGYHSTAEWTDGIKTSLGTPVQVEVRDDKWVGQIKEGQGGKGGGGKGWQPKSVEERNEIIAQTSLNAAVAYISAAMRAGVSDVDNHPALATMYMQDQFFANTIRLARGSEAGARPDASGTRPASEHRSEGGGSRVGLATGEGASTLHTLPPSEPASVGSPAPREVGGLAGTPGTDGESATDTGQATLDDDSAYRLNLMRKMHAIAAEVYPGEDPHDAIKKRTRDPAVSLADYPTSKLEKMVDVLAGLQAEKETV